MSHGRFISSSLACCLAIFALSAAIADDAPGKTGNKGSSDSQQAADAVADVASQTGQAIFLIGVGQEIARKCKEQNNCDQQKDASSPKDGN